MGKIVCNEVEYSTSPSSAKNINYNNETSKLAGNNIQSAVDEIAGDVAGLNASLDELNASQVGYKDTNVESALDLLSTNTSDLSKLNLVGFTYNQDIVAPYGLLVTSFRIGKFVYLHAQIKTTKWTSGERIITMNVKPKKTSGLCISASRISTDGHVAEPFMSTANIDTNGNVYQSFNTENATWLSTIWGVYEIS